eukprot:352337-Chlamydomonas_euryale.AAC.2
MAARGDRDGAAGRRHVCQGRRCCRCLHRPFNPPLPPTHATVRRPTACIATFAYDLVSSQTLLAPSIRPQLNGTPGHLSLYS